MKFDWTSDSTEVLINPRLTDHEDVVQQLQDVGLKGHFWVATSGSLGMKWVALSKEAVLSSAAAVNKHLDLGKKESWAHPLPDFHVGGLGIWARAHLSAAHVADYKLIRAWDPQHFVKFIKEEKTSVTSLVPTQLYDIVMRKLKAPRTLSAVIIGGGRLDGALHSEAIKLGWPCLPSYGLTECCSQVATAKPLQPFKLIPLPHMELRFQGGVVEIKSPALLTCYATFNPSFELHYPVKEGWFLTEDLGEMRGEELVLHGRGGAYIKVGGEGVSLVRLSDILSRVRLDLYCDEETVLIALPDERLGHAVHLVAERESLRLRHVIEEYQRRVLPYERIRAVHLVKRIPRSPMGKVLFKELQDEVFAALK